METKMPEVQSDLGKEVKALRIATAGLFMEIKDFRKDGEMPKEGGRVLRDLEQRLGLLDTQVRLHAATIKELEGNLERIQRTLAMVENNDRIHAERITLLTNRVNSLEAACNG